MSSRRVLFLLAFVIAGATPGCARLHPRDAPTTCSVIAITTRSLRSSPNSPRGPANENVPMVHKCCPENQNFSRDAHECVDTQLPFHPMIWNSYYVGNEEYIDEWKYNFTRNLIHNPCKYGGYKLDPKSDPDDLFFVLTNGSLLTPCLDLPLLGNEQFCLESFWSENGSMVLPYVCAEPEQHTVMWTNIVAGVMIFSVPFLLATALTFLLVPEVSRTRHAPALGYHTACMAIAFLVLACVQLTRRPPSPACSFTAYIIHYFFLACFFWLNIMCIDLYLNVVGGVRHTRFYHYWAWGGPLIVVLLTLAMDQIPSVPLSFQRPDIGKSGCWFQSTAGAALYFYVPVVVVLVINVLMFVLTAHALAHNQHASSVPGIGTVTPMQGNFRQTFRLCASLVLVMGLSWLLEGLSGLIGGNNVLWTFGDLFNALQGVTIFIIFVTPQDILTPTLEAIKRQKQKVWANCCLTRQ